MKKTVPQSKAKVVLRYNLSYPVQDDVHPGHGIELAT